MYAYPETEANEVAAGQRRLFIDYQTGAAVPHIESIRTEMVHARLRFDAWRLRKSEVKGSLGMRLWSADPRRYKSWKYLDGPNLNAFALRKRRGKDNGHHIACVLAKARKDGPNSEHWAEVINADDNMVRAGVFPETIRTALMAAYHQVANVWRPIGWHYPPDIAAIAAHFVHASVEDPTQVAYYPSIRHLLERREVRTRPGKYLIRYYGGVLSEAVIRDMANAHIAKYSPVTVNFVESDDPDGWEWVYEHGRGFTSCMVYNHPQDRYLAKGLYGVNHPVRAYARGDNGLRLAWIGEKYMDDGGFVTARAIVRDDTSTTPPTPLGYVRLYGDDSKLRTALAAAGYKDNVSLYGVELERREYDGQVICPYLDSGSIADCGGYLEIVRDGRETSSNGLLDDDDCVTCEDCGNTGAPDEMYYAGRNEEYCVCRSCYEGEYVYAIGRRGANYVIHNNYAVRVGDDYYDVNYLSDNDIVQCGGCGEYVHLDDAISSDDGVFCDDCVVRLDRESPEGYDYAGKNYATHTEGGETIHVDHAVTDYVTGAIHHEHDMLTLKQFREILYIHPDTILANPRRFSVMPDYRYPECFYLLLDCPQWDALTLRDWSAEGAVSNVEDGDETDINALLEELYYDAHPEPLRLAA